MICDPPEPWSQRVIVKYVEDIRAHTLRLQRHVYYCRMFAVYLIESQVHTPTGKRVKVNAINITPNT